MYLEVNLLITIHQLWKVETSVSILNLDESLLILYGNQCVPISSIVRLIDPPQYVTKLNNHQVVAMSWQVGLSDM